MHPTPSDTAPSHGLAHHVAALAITTATTVRAPAPFSTYPEDHAGLIALAKLCERSDDENAVRLGDWVRAILEDEAVAARAEAA